MTTELYRAERRGVRSPTRRLVEQAYARATGARLVRGNGVRLLKDAEENYPAWLAAFFCVALRNERTSFSANFLSCLTGAAPCSPWPSA